MSDHELLPLYVLDALPDDERRAFDAHLGTCEVCTRELASYHPALDELAGAAVEPPSSLRDRVLAEAALTPQERLAPQPLPERPAPPPLSSLVPRRRDTGSRRVFALAAAVLAVALVAASATAVGLLRRTDALEQQLAELQRTDRLAAAAVEVLAADDVRLVEMDTDLTGAVQVAVSESSDRGVVLADGLEVPPADRAYQLWLVEGGQPRSAGVAATADGVLGELVDVGRAEAVAISVEPPDGSAQPTGDIVAQAALE